MMGCLHMHMLKNVSLHVIAVSITLSLFGCFVRCFYLAMLFGSFIRCFHLAICASTPVTLIFILILRVTCLDSRLKRWQSRPTSGSQGSKCEHIGGKNFRGGSNTSVEFGPGVQLLRRSKYYVTVEVHNLIPRLLPSYSSLAANWKRCGPENKATECIHSHVYSTGQFPSILNIHTLVCM